MKVAIAFVVVVSLAQLSAAMKDRDRPVPAIAAPQPAAVVGNTSDAGAVTITTVAPIAPVVSPQPVTMAVATPIRSEIQHSFFDFKNCAALAAAGVGLTGDALSTQKGLGLPGFHEVNPIARPFVQNRPGAAFYSAASFAFMAGGMYLAHRTHHHKLERILPFAAAGWEGFLTFHNYHLISSSTQTR